MGRLRKTFPLGTNHINTHLLMVVRDVVKVRGSHCEVIRFPCPYSRRMKRLELSFAKDGSSELCDIAFLAMIGGNEY